ncbi:hypothetical protein CHARACLAT_017294 [Characodon lateralis]|uniref:Uncharacterized protein n=1 Tax=Characodon lateralis TaxID=208331 RepID=A0ABU7DKF3_9TELE|nr:hypothetical protein [Characodon lateralis]
MSSTSFIPAEEPVTPPPLTTPPRKPSVRLQESRQNGGSSGMESVTIKPATLSLFQFISVAYKTLVVCKDLCLSFHKCFKTVKLFKTFSYFHKAGLQLVAAIGCEQSGGGVGLFCDYTQGGVASTTTYILPSAHTCSVAGSCSRHKRSEHRVPGTVPQTVSSLLLDSEIQSDIQG